MRQEIEILVRVLDTKTVALRALRRFHAEGMKKISDWYFIDPLRKGLHPSATFRLKESCRIRQQNHGASVTYKVDRFTRSGQWTHSEEYECPIANAEEMRKIFLKLGLKPLVTLESEKQYFRAGRYELVLEDVKNLGLFLEIESLARKHREVSQTRTAMQKFLRSIPLRLGKETDAGKPELLLRALRD